MVRELAHPTPSDFSLVTVLAALADPIRLRIVRGLSSQSVALTCSAFDLPISASTTTHHFRVLRESGIIAQHYEGTAILSTLRRNDLDARFPGLLNAVLAS